MELLENRVAFITGGASGIGLGMARAFLKAGMKVVITYRSDEHLRSALTQLRGQEDRVHAIKLEITERDSVEHAAEQAERRFGPVHVLCNNAAVGITAPVVSATIADWNWAIDVNIRGVINGIQSFLPRMLAHGQEAHILSTASMGGLFHGSNVGVYNTTKYAVVGMMEALRADLSGTNIGVSVLCPGLVDTDIHMTERFRPPHYANSGDPASDAERLRRADLFKRNILSCGMDPLEVGELVVEGIRRNHLYILTHPEYESGIRERFEAIMAAVPDTPPPPKRVQAEVRVLRNSMYALERDRRVRANTTTPV